jgi:hypothetical protein
MLFRKTGLKIGLKVVISPAFCTSLVLHHVTIPLEAHSIIALLKSQSFESLSIFVLADAAFKPNFSNRAESFCKQ